MADLGPSIVEIEQARNQKIQQEAEPRQDADHIAQELKDAHSAALHIREKQQSNQGSENGTQTQAFPHGPIITKHQGPTMSERVQQAQSDLYSNIKDKTSAASEALKENVAAADQDTTTKLRDATATAASKVNEAATGVAAGAGAVIDKAREAVKGALGMADAADDSATGGRVAAYEGAVFGSDDPDYKTDAPAGVAESLGPLNSEANRTNPTIASPKEPVEGVAAGDPAGGANVVAAARTAGKGIFASVTDALGLGAAEAPAGPPPDHPDPRTEGVPVGDFKGLKEALARTHDTTSDTATAPDTTSSSAVHPVKNIESQTREGMAAAADKAQDAAQSAMQAAGMMDVSSGTGGTASTGGAGGGILSGIASLVSDIASKVNIASSSEELMAGGIVPDEAAGPAAVDGATAQPPAPEAAAAAAAASDAAAAARDKVADSSVGQSMSDAAQSVKDTAAGATDRVKDAVGSGSSSMSDAVRDTAQAAKDTVADAASSARESAQQTAGEMKAAAVSAAESVVRASEVEGMGRSGDTGAATAAGTGSTTTSADQQVNLTAGNMTIIDSNGSATSDTAVIADSVFGMVKSAVLSVAESVVRAMETEGAGASGIGFSGCKVAGSSSTGGSADGKQLTAGDNSPAPSAQDTAGQVLQHVMETDAVYGTLSGPEQCLHKPTPASNGSTAVDPASLTASLKLGSEQVQEQVKHAMAVYETAGRDVSGVQHTDLKAAAGPADTDAAANEHRLATDAGSSGTEAADRARGEHQSAVAATLRSAGGSLIQGAKEGFVGAYDTAADAATSAKESVKDAAARLTGSAQEQAPHMQQQAKDEQTGGGFGHGSGSSSSPSGGGYAGGQGSSLSQAWEDLKHGGSKAPHATSIAGETAASHDVTSNVERSKHLDNPQEAKIYDAEVYRVSPGSQSAGGTTTSDEDKTRAAAGAVAGANRNVTGTTPHDKPDSYGVGADQKTRFDGNKGIGTGFGTGSAAPWTDDAVKQANSFFVNSGNLNTVVPPVYRELLAGASLVPSSSLAMPAGMTVAEQQALIDAAQAAAAAVLSPADRAGSSSESSVCSWVSSMSSVWANLGRAAAKGPTGNEVMKDIKFDNPTQNVMIDPVRGATKSESETPGHKVQMRPADQIPTGGSSSDPHLVQHKAERLGKVVADTLTTSSDQAAADPDNLKGKSSDNKPDGAQYFLKQELSDAGASLSAAPEKASSALGTAAEIGGGMLGHIKDKAGEMLHLHKEHKTEVDQAVVGSGAGAGAVAPGPPAPSVGAGEAADMQRLQEKRMAAIGDPAFKRETLGDKVIGPLVSDARDEERARELAASYHEYKAEKEAGEGASTADVSSSGTPSATADPAAGKSAISGKVDTAYGAQHHHAGKVEDIGTTAQRVGEGVRDVAHEVADKARATGDAAKAEGHKAAETAKEYAGNAADKAAAGVDRIEQGAKGTVREAVDTAKATGDVAKMEVQSGVDSAKHAVQKATQSAEETGQRMKEGVHDTEDRMKQGLYDAGRRADESARETRESAGRAGEQAGSAAGNVLASVGGAAKALLGGLLGPFEKEGSFEESAAVVTGPPKDFEPVGTEQLTGREATAIEASRASRAGAGDTGTAGAAAKATGTATDTSTGSRSTAGAEAPAGDSMVELVKGKLQAGVDDTARAAGLAAGHVESSVEGLMKEVEAAREQVKETVDAVTKDVKLPPTEIPSNTEDIIRMRQQQM